MLYRFVDFCMHRVRMLLHFGVTPYLIFDGDYLPSKAATEKDRAKRREESRKMGLELLNAGKTSQAYLEFQKAVDVTPEMACQVIEELKKIGVQYIVAPYEADAQMVYLERKGIIDGILSEDSDLLVFGAKCLLTKLDQYGNCIEINKVDFCACKDITLTGWSDAEFRRMAILSGCDYLASINNMGLKTAYRFIRKHKTIEKVLKMIQFEGKFHVPKNYLVDFYKAEWTFLHQRVFCPKKLTLVFHTTPDPEVDVENLPYLGAFVEPEIAQGVARGDLNPITKERIILPGQDKMALPAMLRANSTPHQRRSTSIGDAMKGKSIDHFFKPKRTPLAELDVNCFTPSPSQMEVLSRNTGEWPAQPAPQMAPRPYLQRVSSGPGQLSRSEPPQRNRNHARQVSLTLSDSRPPKRARLCADSNELHEPGQKTESGRSRFFNSTNSEQSPTVGRNIRNKRSKNQDIEIFSDDSIEEAMLSLPDFNDFSCKPRNKFAVFHENNSQASETSQDSQSSITDNSQNGLPDLSRATSTASSIDLPPTPSTQTRMTGFKERFAFSQKATVTPISAVITHGQPTPPLSPRASRIPIPVKAKPSNKLLKKPILTPLQRIGVTATTRPKIPVTPLFTPSTNSRRPGIANRKSGIRSVPFPEVATKVAVKTMDVEPASVPLPAANEAENEALNRGSEDLIVHDSEEEEEVLSSGGGEKNERMGFDLKKFAYATTS